jgi:lipoprotein LprG
VSPTARLPTRTVAPAVGAILVVCALASCGGGDSEPAGPTIAPDAGVIVAESAQAMGEVTSVRFELEATGAPVYIDAAGAISLNTIDGRFNVPGSADAVVEVEVGGALNTELGAVAVGDDVWLSNPITGELEPLPPGIDLDPSSFFDPAGGWRPLLENLSDVELIGIEDRDGDRYHLRGTAPAEQVEVITAGLVSDLDVTIDVWVDPVTALVTAVEFTADLGDGETNWALTLSDYGETFDIAPPPEN